MVVETWITRGIPNIMYELSVHQGAGITGWDFSAVGYWEKPYKEEK